MLPLIPIRSPFYKTFVKMKSGYKPQIKTLTFKKITVVIRKELNTKQERFI